MLTTQLLPAAFAGLTDLKNEGFRKLFKKKKTETKFSKLFPGNKTTENKEH